MASPARLLRAACLGPALLALSAAAPAGQEPVPQQPVFRTGVRVVRVDVTVTGRGGQPVDDLTAADFTLEEDGVPQPIDSAQFVRLDGHRGLGDEDSLAIRSPEHGEAEAAREDVRLFALFFDDYHVDKTPGITVPMRRAMEAFVRQLGPTDLVTVMDPLTPLSALRFTRDRQWLAEQVKKWEGRQGETFPIKSALEESHAYARNRAMLRAEITLSALNALVTRLGSLREGRKSVIFVSQGPPTFFGVDGDIEGVMRELLQNASRGNVAIHALDPRGLGDSGRGGLRDTLLRLAYETGGRPIVNTNGLERGLERVVEFASAYYILGYTPTRESDDGKFHKIQVKVKRPGTDVLARRGYWAPSAEAVEAAIIEASKPPVEGVAEALAPMSAPRDGRVVDVWTGFQPVPGGPVQARVTWEPAERLPAGSPAPERLTVELIAQEDGTAMGEPVVLASSRGVVESGALAVFDLPEEPAVALRFAATAADGSVLDRWTQPVEPPAVTGEAFWMGTLEFHRARSVVELRALRAAASAAPSASRRFVRTDRVRIEAALPGVTAEVTATAELLNKTGQRLATLPSEVGGGRVSLELPLTSLVPSTYLVRVRVAAGERTAEQVVAFEMGR